ncbi:hypothetical protein LCGC14_0408500 [marine sediment metagenome]|uniref:Uncharacterized protein n=1 Tax=marine sediment metagenome TaxID=412755 RepID=A0A0F9W3G9_9ZZZZ
MSRRLLPGTEYPKVNPDGGLQLTSDITVQDYMKWFGDRTLLAGGAITDNGDGTVAIASLTAWISVTDSESAVGRVFAYAGGNTAALTDLTTNYIYLDYNGGTPQLVVSTSILTHGFKLDHIHIGTAFRDGTETHFHKPTNFELDLGATVDMHHQEEDLVHQVEGLTTTETGTRNLLISAGVMYEGLNRHTSLPFDTSRSGTADFNEVNKLHDAGGDFSVNDVGKSVHNTTDDTYGTITAFVDSTELTLDADIFPLGTENYTIDFWTYHYYDGDLGPAAWVEVHGATQISNSQYNDVATGLANFTANRYGVSWVFMEIDGLHFHIVYGQGDYKVNEAEEAGVPSSLPNIVTNYCALIAKIILQQGQTTMTITYPWTTVFTSNFATDHGSLGGLGDDDHTQYILHSLADAANDFLVASGNDAYVKKTLAETLALISPLTTRGDIMFRNATVNTRLAKGADNTILAMGANDPEWKAPATILADIAALPLAGGTMAGNIVMGTNDITGVGTLKTARLTLTSDQLEEHATNGNAGTVALNFNGYLGGTTRFRDVDIYNGKQTRYGLFDGSASRFTVDNFGATTLQGKLTAGAIEIEGSAFDINGGTIDGVTITAPVLDGTVTNTGAALVMPTFGMGAAAITGHAQAITDNAILTVDQVTPVATDYARFTANGLEGRDKTEILGDLNVADGADVTGSNAPQAHKASHQDIGGDEISVAALSGLLADDQHVLDTEALAAAEAGATSVATASKLVIRDGSARAKFAAPGAAGDPLIKGTRHLIAEMPTLTTGKIWKGVAGVPAEADEAGGEAVEGHLTLLPWNYNSIGQGTWVISIDSVFALNTRFWNPTQADGDNVTYKVYLAAGTYTLRILGRTQNVYGIGDIYIDAAEVASFDWYSGSTIEAVVFSQTSISVATSGFKDIKIIVDGKNGSSSSYYINLHSIAFWRTA